MLKIRTLAFACVLGVPVALLPAQGTPASYRDAPATIARMLDARPTPVLALSPRRNWFVVLERRGMATIAEVAEPHLKLAGTRLNPATNGPAGASGYVGMTLQRVSDLSLIHI